MVGPIALKFGGIGAHHLPPLGLGDRGLAHPEALHLHQVLRAFIVLSLRVIRRRTHHKAAGWDGHHGECHTLPKRLQPGPWLLQPWCGPQPQAHQLCAHRPAVVAHRGAGQQRPAGCPISEQRSVAMDPLQQRGRLAEQLQAQGGQRRFLQLQDVSLLQKGAAGRAPATANDPAPPPAAAAPRPAPATTADQGAVSAEPGSASPRCWWSLADRAAHLQRPSPRSAGRACAATWK